jgi:hypothetical protein
VTKRAPAGWALTRRGSAQRHYAPLVGTDGFKLRLQEPTLYSSIYRFDTHMLVDIHLYAANAYSAPVMYLRQLQGASPLFNAYGVSFEAVRETGRVFVGGGER